MDTPVLLIVFNRPEAARRVFSEIAKARPKKLFIAADGPRANHVDDRELCAETRKVAEMVDWDCEVRCDFARSNQGCGRRVASAISWFFEQVDRGIILEDDCLPHPSFFPFCDELLERYRNDTRVMQIAGVNFAPTPDTGGFSYTFTSQPGTWGWATWRRAWRFYDFKIKLWPLLHPTGWLLDVFKDHRVVRYYEAIFHKAHNENCERWTWDYQWLFACWANSGLSIQPTVNLISNIGFGERATHTHSVDDPHSKLPVGEVSFPLVHPLTVVRDPVTDRRFLEAVVMLRLPKTLSFVQRIRRRVVHELRRLVFFVGMIQVFPDIPNG